MRRQERTAKATKRAAAQADAIIEAAVRKVRCKGCGTRGTVDELRVAGHGADCKASQTAAKPTSRRTRVRVAEPAGSAGSDGLAAECKRLRDEHGLSWMAIGAKLSLPGSKNGAARARALYRAANGGNPHQSTRAVRRSDPDRAPRAPRTPRHAANSGSKVERKLRLLEQGHVIPEDTTDEAVVALVAGRTIEWGVNVARFGGGDDHWVNLEARVHPTDVGIFEEDYTPEGERVLRFREFLGFDDDRKSSTFGKPLGGPTRTVRVNAIHTVR